MKQVTLKRQTDGKYKVFFSGLMIGYLYPDYDGFNTDIPCLTKPEMYNGKHLDYLRQLLKVFCNYNQVTPYSFFNQ